VLIVGGGAGGVTVAARLLRSLPDADVAIVDPAEYHYYQPLWTLVGGGMFPREASRRRQADVIPPGATWVQDAAQKFLPGESAVVTRDGTRLEYDFLVVAPGLRVQWDAVEGLEEALATPGVCSNYSYDTVPRTWDAIRTFGGGKALFTHPAGAVKCGGAPQKICYLAEDYWRRAGRRDACEVTFASANDRIFAVDRYARTLERVLERKGIVAHFKLNLVAVRSAQREAVFRRAGSDEEAVLPYDLLHVTPPMGPPACVAQSPLADAEGWVDVDKYSLQHRRYANVFGLGDASNLPTSKTAAAIRKQAPVVVENLLAAADGGPLTAKYDGYTSCPIVTGYDSLVLAEFDYDKRPCETFPVDQSQERFSMLALKKYALPALYWHGMLKGRA
jgi:sulfide:quinone oxidoreductase